MPFRLADFDREVLAEHGITQQEIENARRYVVLLQGANSQTYADISGGCYYATSGLLHEVVELRVLLKRDRWLLVRSRQRANKFLQDNEDAHVEALQVEYPYLQRKIAEIFGARVGIGELVRANASKWDFDRLFNSDLDLPIFFPTDAEIERAWMLLERLKRFDRSKEHGAQ
ncbi:MAG: hypothetical protein FJ014_03590 [Chloroflexi bacterium]|nr:hypothetical protein [Chloroflexota bacterium]